MKAKQGLKTGVVFALAMLLFGSCKEEELYTIPEFTKLSCTFNNQEIPNGRSITAYSAESLIYDTKCTSIAETRTCNDGELSGTFEFASCIEEPPANCSFDNQIVLHEDYVEAFQLSAVEWNQSCNDYRKIRTCDNGTLSEADYIFPSCTVTEPLDCTFDSQIVLHGADVEAYQLSSVPWNETCSSYREIRSCENGVLSGQGFAFSSCEQVAPDNCSFNEQLVEHQSSVTAWQTSSVPHGNTCASQERICTNGQLSGSYSFSSCGTAAPDNCSAADYGQFVQHNTSEQFWQTATVPYGSSCQPQDRFCNNGTLSGSYTFAACSVSEASGCDFSDGGSTAHDPNAFLTLYNTASSDWPATCEAHVSSSVTCNNGDFSPVSLAAYSYQSCDNGTPQSCTLNTPGGGSSTIAHDASATAYSAQSVVFGTDGGCDSVKVEAKCYDSDFVDPNDVSSVLFGSGTYYDACSIGDPSGCTLVGLNGATLNFAHDEDSAIPGFTTNLEPFVDDNTVCPASVDLFCYNGELKLQNGTLNTESGHTFGACQVAAPGGCSWFGDSYSHGATVTAYEFNNSADGLCSSTETRTCNNGTWTGTFAYDNCLHESILVGTRYNANSEGLEFTTIPLDINGNYYQEKQGTYDNSNGSSVKIGIGEVQGTISNGIQTVPIIFSGGSLSDTVVGNSISLAVTIVIDSSTSMQVNDENDLRYSAADSLISLMPNNTLLNVYDFQLEFKSPGPHLVEDVTLGVDRQSIYDAIVERSDRNGTPLYDTMYFAMDKIVSKTQSRKMLISLTDGQDDQNGVASAVTSRDTNGIVEIHNIGLGSEIDLNFKTLPNSADAGGSYRNVLDAANLAELFENLGKTTSIGYAKTTGTPDGLTLQPGVTYTATITVRGISQTVEFVR